ncbi:MAG TPA: pyridoxamine 5'-phosphate oxidase family protein, partial [Solirubrobacteraceae bacterium]
MTEPPPGTPGLRTLRHEYETHGLDRADLDPDPLAQFARWYEDAAAEGIYEPHAVALATVASDGRPACRYVLLRGVDER